MLRLQTLSLNSFSKWKIVILITVRGRCFSLFRQTLEMWVENKTHVFYWHNDQLAARASELFALNLFAYWVLGDQLADWWLFIVANKK